jgi:hypothetical protein
MNRKSKLELLNNLIYEIRKQTANGIHTMSMCTVCNKHPARGSGPCGKCLTNELGLLVGNGPAISFYNVVRHQNTIVSNMQEKFE